MKFEKIQPGMILYDVHSERMGNTTMRTMGCWPVRIVSIDAEKRTAVVVWNSVNRPETYYARQLEKLRAKEPILVKCGYGRRLLRRGETPPADDRP